MEQASLIIGNGNWAVKSGSLLGYTMFNEQFYPQYVTASRATTATRVDENGLIVTSSIGIARIDYSTGEAALLVEPQRTNLLTYSEDFGVWDINAGGISSIEPNYAISPEGVENAYKVNFVVQGDSDLALVKGHSVTGGSTYAYSIYIKGEGSDIGKDIVVKSKRSGGGDSAGTTTTQTLTGEWVRVDFTTTYAANNTAASFYISSNDATSCLIYGAQAEEGSYATSYIPTYGTSVTRNQDVCLKTGATALIGQTEGTLYAEFNLTNLVGDRTIFEIGADNSNRIRLRVNGSYISANVVLAGSVVANITFVFQPLGNYKFAYAYKQNDFQAYLNGNAGTAVTSGNIPSNMSIIGVGTRIVAADIFNDSISTAALWKERLSDSELATLTTL